MRALRVRRAWRCLVVVLWMGGIFYLSAQPDLPHHPGAMVDTILKKGGHMVEYGVLAGLVFWTLRGDGQAGDKRAILGALVVTALYAISDEVHQRFVPGRTPHPLDVGFDVVGASLALLLIRRLSLPGLTSRGVDKGR